jgi:quinoprotein glucose dehydrogenase
MALASGGKVGKMFPSFRLSQAALWAVLTGGVVLADPAADGGAPLAPAPDALAAAQRLRVAPGLKLSLWAGEPLVQNITSVGFDNQGGAYVVETGRRRTSVFDIRSLTQWLDEDLSFRSVGDRVQFLRQVLDPADPRYSAFLGAVTKGGIGGFKDFNGDGRIDWKDLETESERIRFVWDSNGDGIADRWRTFAEGFATSVSGVAAGVMVEGTNVWFTCIPDVWRFPATASREPAAPKIDVRDGKFDSARMLSGFGVHIAFGGHDLHGLIKGPDGRIYFTIADRGASVTNREGRVFPLPDSGAVFRCEPDGSNFKIFAKGLRNPQELAFDAFGNLWTADNNADGGDKARWTLLLEGADYGWTIGWQWLPKLGAWNSERLWHTRESNTAAYIMPPVAHIGHGPAGIAYYPGTGLGDRFNGHFFYADFPGGIRSFRVEPDGAFFKIAQADGAGDSWKWMEDNSPANMTGKVLWDLSPVDVTFPPFGGLIVADWVQGWEKTGKGRLWHVTDPALANDPQIAEVRKILGEGMSGRRDRELISLLGHRDQRVRLEAQWELAGRGSDVVDRLKQTALESDNRMARLHALWTVTQIARKHAGEKWGKQLAKWLPLLKDKEPEIRGQSAKMFAAARRADAAKGIVELFADTDLRARFLAIEAAKDLWSHPSQWQQDIPPLEQTADSLRALPLAGKIMPSRKYPHYPDHSWEIARILAESSEIDPSTVQVLSRSVDVEDSFKFLGDPVYPSALFGRAVIGRAGYGVKIHHNALKKARHADRLRLACLLKLRESGDVVIERFLGATNPVLVLEAARAINDVPIGRSFPALAALLDDRTRFAKEAASWTNAVNFSREEWRTWVLRRSANAAFRLGGESNAIALAKFAAWDGAPESVRVEALEALAEWGAAPKRDRIVGLYRPIPQRDDAPARAALGTVWQQVSGSSAPASVVIASIRAGDRLKLGDLAETLARLINHADSTVRKEAARIHDAAAATTFESVVAGLERGSLKERQLAFAKLATSTNAGAVPVLVDWLSKLSVGVVEPELQADLLDAARAVQGNTPVSMRLAEWTNSLPKDDVLAAFRPALAGGDASNGAKLFAERADLGCQRCHKLRGDGGEVGPDLTGIGKAKGRAYVLKAILQPNAEIAAGFENVLLEKTDGTSIGGVLKSENETTLTLDSPEDGRLVIAKSEIKTRERGLSAMPEGLGDLMSLRELRDLIEVLSE